jgi:hypothetical protein
VCFSIKNIKKFKLSWGSLTNVPKNNFSRTNISVKKMGQKSVNVILCVNNHSKRDEISKLEQFCRFFVLKYLSEVYLTFPDIFGRKIQILLFFIYKIQIS